MSGFRVNPTAETPAATTAIGDESYHKKMSMPTTEQKSTLRIPLPARRMSRKAAISAVPSRRGWSCSARRNVAWRSPIRWDRSFPVYGLPARRSALIPLAIPRRLPHRVSHLANLAGVARPPHLGARKARRRAWLTCPLRDAADCGGCAITDGRRSANRGRGVTNRRSRAKRRRIAAATQRTATDRRRRRRTRP